MIVAGGIDGENNLDSVFIYSVSNGVDAATWSESTKMPVARRYFGMAYIPAQDGGGGGQVMVAGGYDGGKTSDSVSLYSVNAATWSASTAMPVATLDHGMTYIPAEDASTKGQVMVVGGRGDGGKYLDSVYFSAPVTTTTTTTTTTAAATTITTTITTTTTTTTTLGVNARCDPLADACDSSSNLACAADVYECRYATATTTVTPSVSPANTTRGSNATVVVVLVVVLALLVLAGGCWWFAVGRHRKSRHDNNGGDLGEFAPVAMEMMLNPMPVAAAARAASLGGGTGGGGSDNAAPRVSQTSTTFYNVGVPPPHATGRTELGPRKRRGRLHQRRPHRRRWAHPH